MSYSQSDKLIEYLTKVNEIPEPEKNKKDIKGLSPKTKKGYIRKLTEFEKDLYDATGLYIEDALTTKDAREIWDKLIKNPSYNLIKKQAIISALNSIYKYLLLKTVEDKKNKNEVKYRKAYYSWAIIKKEVYEAGTKKALSNEATDNQKEIFVDWETIQKTRDLIGNQKYNQFNNTGYGSDIHLIMALYTYSEYGVYPGRADYYNVKIHKKKPDADTLSKGNHIIVKGKTSLLYLNDYKTSKTYGVHKFEFPEIVTKIIKANIKNYNIRYKDKTYKVEDPETKEISKVPYEDKKYLLMNTKGQKFGDSSSYCIWLKRSFEKIFKKKVGVNALRHSYISSDEYKKKNTYEKKQIARYMMHSFETAAGYKFDNIGGSDGDKEELLSEIDSIEDSVEDSEEKVNSE
jgi:hypothetical protein